MLLTTTQIVPGKEITDVRGIVHAEAVLGIHVGKDLMAGFRNIVGGRSSAYENEINQASETCLEELGQRAAALGADAVVAIEMDIGALGADGNMLMVIATGTAVTLR